MEKLIEYLVCPRCKSKLIDNDSTYICTECDQEYPINNKIPIFILPDVSKFKLDEAEFQSRTASDYAEMHGLDSLRIKYLHDDFLSPIFTLPKGSLILEVGCGTGEDLLNVVKKGHNVIGLDISYEMCITAQKRMDIEGFSHEACFSVSDAEELPFDSNLFDAAYMVASLHHLEDPLSGLKEISRCVKPGGLVIIGSEPNSWPYLFKTTKHSKIGIRFLKMFRDDPTLYQGSPEDWETTGFDRKGIRELLNKAELRELEIKPIWYTNGFLQALGLRPPSFIERFLIYFDELLSKVPVINRFGWHWNVVAKNE